VHSQIEVLLIRIAQDIFFVYAVNNEDKQVAQITFNDDILNIMAAILEEKKEFV
jgi:type I restriction enzyme R subunit